MHRARSTRNRAAASATPTTTGRSTRISRQNSRCARCVPEMAEDRTDSGANLSEFVGHEEEGLVIEAGELGAQPRGVVLLLNVDDLFDGGDGLERNVVVVTVFEDDEAAADVLQEEIESEIAVGHGGDGVNGIGIAATNEITEFLIDDVDFLAVVEFGGEVSYPFADDFADATELFVAIGVGAFAFENHFATLEHGAFRDEDDGVAAGIFAAG